MFGTAEMILILVVVLLLFGPDKLPELARSIGKSAKEFKKAQIQVENGLTGQEESQTERDSKIYKLAIEMGIDIKGKTPEQLVEEIRMKVRQQTEK